MDEWGSVLGSLVFRGPSYFICLLRVKKKQRKWAYNYPWWCARKNFECS